MILVSFNGPFIRLRNSLLLLLLVRLIRVQLFLSLWFCLRRFPVHRFRIISWINFCLEKCSLVITRICVLVLMFYLGNRLRSLSEALLNILYTLGVWWGAFLKWIVRARIIFLCMRNFSGVMMRFWKSLNSVRNLSFLVNVSLLRFWITDCFLHLLIVRLSWCSLIPCNLFFSTVIELFRFGIIFSLIVSCTYVFILASIVVNLFLYPFILPFLIVRIVFFFVKSLLFPSRFSLSFIIPVKTFISFYSAIICMLEFRLCLSVTQNRSIFVRFRFFLIIFILFLDVSNYLIFFLAYRLAVKLWIFIFIMLALTHFRQGWSTFYYAISVESWITRNSLILSWLFLFYRRSENDFSFLIFSLIKA